MPPTTGRRQWPLSVVRVIYVLTALVVFSHLLVGAMISLPRKIILHGSASAPDLIQMVTLPLAVLSLGLGFGPKYRTRRARVSAILFSAVFSLLMAAQVVRLMDGRHHHHVWHPHIEITVCAALIVSQMFALALLLCTVKNGHVRRGLRD